jgi:hypothetical protein
MMAFDGAAVLMFGGILAGSANNEMWRWDGTSWSGPHASTAVPVGRYQAAAAYDSARGRVVMFGGSEQAAGIVDTLWEWSGAGWLGPIAPATRPSARDAHAMAYDSIRGRVVLFGGRNGADLTLLDDVWEWDGIAWYGPFRPTPRPSARRWHGMAFAANRNRTVLFGGNDGARKDDVWEWNGATWSGPTQPSPRPSPRDGVSLAYNALRTRVVLFGGHDGTSSTSDIWEWSGTAWSGPTQPFTRPSARNRNGFAYDSVRRTTVLFGGTPSVPSNFVGGSNGAVDDSLWELPGISWDGPFLTTPRPRPRAGHIFAYDSARGRSVMFGGYVADEWNDELFEWSAPRERRPAAQLVVDTASLGAAPGNVQGMRVRAHCGGRARVNGSGAFIDGALLSGWSAGGSTAAPGAWVPLASNGVGRNLPAPPGALMTWSSLSAAEASAYLYQPDSTASFRCEPVDGSGQTDAEVAVDYLEVRVRYTTPP